MYKVSSCNQITFFDFNQSCGFQLDPKNEWVVLASRIDWDSIEESYAKLFPGKVGCPAKTARIALGSLIIQKAKGLSDRALCKEISENPYLQYFIGLKQFKQKCPFTAPALVSFRKRFSYELVNEINENYLITAGCTAEHKEKESKKESASTKGNQGTAILDATCSPQNIKFPVDYELLNNSIKVLEKIIDYFHENYHPWEKPRTYREVLRKCYLAVAKRRIRSQKEIRKLIRKQLEAVKRDISYIDKYEAAGYEIPKKWYDQYHTILTVYEQQKYMYDNKTHQVENRIVSISQPYVRPVVRGKSKSPVEFGAKYDVCVDEKGHARLEQVSFDPYNESTIFQDVIERYRKRTGHYPERVLADQIYRNRENRKYCKEHNIRLSGPKLGRQSKDEEKNKAEKKTEYNDNTDRIEVERFFSLDKRNYGAALIKTKLLETSLTSIALSILTANLFSTVKASFFLLYFFDDGSDYGKQYFIQLNPPAE